MPMRSSSRAATSVVTAYIVSLIVDRGPRHAVPSTPGRPFNRLGGMQSNHATALAGPVRRRPALCRPPFENESARVVWLGRDKEGESVRAHHQAAWIPPR